MISAYVGIGSNQGDPQARVLEGIEALRALPGSRLVARSRLYRSAPVDAPGQPDFVNAVAALETELGAVQLLDALLAIERRHGRERPHANAPRTLDLDLLLYGDTTLAAPTLIVPHPRMHERAFVLRPLLELDPCAAVPGRGSARDLLQACAEQIAEPIE